MGVTLAEPEIGTAQARSPAKPILFLDVDGVICPMGLPAGYVRVQTDQGDWISFSEENVSRLHRLAQSFRLVWATSWEHHANDILAPIHRIGPLPVVEWDTDHLGGGSFRPDSQPEDWTGYHDWKLPWIERYAGDTPFAWVDDEISHFGERWAAARETPTLLLRTRSSMGLTDEHVQRLFDFAWLLRYS